MQMRSSAYWLFACLAVVALAGLPTVAAADEWGSCVKLSDDLAVAACSRAIASGEFRGEELAKIYANRGTEYKNKGDLDRAIADYSEAIRLDPKYVDAYDNRGDAWEVKGDLDRAIADYNEAIRLNPKYASSYFNRGVVREEKRSLQEAVADFETYSQLVPSDPDGRTSVERVRKKLNAR